ncbi:MAG: hypothetical protein JKY48_20510 [Flavobacteriales bacterium]|nr:hypothetical protein [Flavobacteriales bacterium]
MIKSIKTSFPFILNFIVFLCFISPIQAQEFNINDDGVAMHGFDAVSYFGPTPQSGKTSISAIYKDHTFLFSSPANREAFLLTPDSYLPQFGGYCAYGVRMGQKFDVDPEAYTVLDGKLYMLLNRATKELWEKDRERNIGIAQQLWSSIKPIPAVQLEDNK